MGIDVLIYQRGSGQRPFLEWLECLRDETARSIVRLRIRRLQCQNLGDRKYVGDGVFELRIHFGPGLRVYFGQVRQDAIVLLCGGNKSSQKRDIVKAKFLLWEFKNANRQVP